MGSSNGGCCDKSHDDYEEKHYKSVWTKTPVGEYGGEPNFLSAAVYNQLINEMYINKNNIQAHAKISTDKYNQTSSAAIPGYVSSGSRYSAADWNNTCNQIAALISDAKRLMNNGFSAGAGTIPASESEAYNLRYSAGEVVTSSKSITRLINLVRRARIHCACHVQQYQICNHCAAHTCKHDGCCQKSND